MNAIILAAGTGMRMVPINTEEPKGLLEVRGEILIERMIRQLHRAGVFEIYIVVGFLKERFEYLREKYHVVLVENEDYTKKNNLFSLKLVSDRLSNTYIIPSDVWCEKNPFHRRENKSWYMVRDELCKESGLAVNEKGQLERVPEGEEGNAVIGLCCLLEQDAAVVRDQVDRLCAGEGNEDAFWEDALFSEEAGLVLNAKTVSGDGAVEFNTYEQLREFDSGSRQLQSDAITTVADALKVSEYDITDITILKKGMTNRSFLFHCQGKKYIMRIPGEGTDRLINREEEAEVYQVIRGRQVSDDIVYMNPGNGYKVTEFLQNSRVCDPFCREDTEKCMRFLRKFHEMKLETGHSFDIFAKILYYESLWEGAASVYADYSDTKRRVFALKPYIEAHAGKKVLTHIDAVPDNFLFTEDGGVRLIDWEYAGMQDPHVDIAMFCIYSLYDRSHIDQLIDLYFAEGCTEAVRIKIYAYIAACGLLWSNWCEYKRSMGVEFDEYSLCQYQYAVDYGKLVRQELEKRGEYQNA